MRITKYSLRHGQAIIMPIRLIIFTISTSKHGLPGAKPTAPSMKYSPCSLELFFSHETIFFSHNISA
jgi:hypothetical protein